MRIAPAALLVVSATCLCSLPACSKDSSSSADGGAAPSSGGLIGALKSAITPNTTPFEGTMDLKITEASRPAPVSISLEVKGSKLRFNMADPKIPGGTAAGVLDMKTKKILTFVDQQKMYMEMDLSAVAPHTPPPVKAMPKIEKTGKHETIAGHDCEDWNITDTASGKKGMLCMASDIGSFDFGAFEGTSFMPSLLTREIFGNPGFPIKIVGSDASGKQEVDMEATRIERKTLDEARFAPPAGYTKLDVGNMLGGHGIPGMGPGGMGRPPGAGVMPPAKH